MHCFTHGGPVVLGKKWADSLLGRIGLVKRKATKAARKLPDDFADVKVAFLQRVASVVKESSVPFELVINWDQTESKFVPASQWILADEGTKQVDVIGVEDKREMIGLLAITLAGKLLPNSTTLRRENCQRFPSWLGCMAFPKSLEHRRNYDLLH